MLHAIGDCLCDLARSDHEEDGEDAEDEEDTALGKLSEVNEPGWVMGTISKMVQYRSESFRQTQMKLDKRTQARWGEAADYFQERDMKYGMAELMVPAIVKPQTDTAAAALLPKTFGELMQTLDTVPGKLQMPQGTSRPGSSQMRLGSEKLQSHTDIVSLWPDTVANSLPMEKGKTGEPGNLNPRFHFRS
jgi:hypothetical protein